MVLNKIGRIDLCQDFRHSDSGREHPDPEAERLAAEFGVPPQASRGGPSRSVSLSHRDCLSVRNYPWCCHNSRTLRWEECRLQRGYEDIPLVEVDGLHRQARQWRSTRPCHQLGSCSDPVGL